LKPSRQFASNSCRAARK